MGYPTQKSLVPVERIIRASSDIDDFVFDPFYGCATALVAADRLKMRGSRTNHPDDSARTVFVQVDSRIT